MFVIVDNETADVYYFETRLQALIRFGQMNNLARRTGLYTLCI